MTLIPPKGSRWEHHVRMQEEGKIPVIGRMPSIDKMMEELPPHAEEYHRKKELIERNLKPGSFLYDLIIPQRIMANKTLTKEEKMKQIEAANPHKKKTGK